MVLQHKALDVTDVVAVIKQRGYNDARTGRWALAVATKLIGEDGSPIRYSTGSFGWKVIGGVTAEELDAILLYSSDVEDAANRIISKSTSGEMAPFDSDRARSASSGLDMDAITRMVQNRIDFESRAILEKVMAVLGEVRSVEARLADLELQWRNRPRPGRPKGSKNRASEPAAS